MEHKSSSSSDSTTPRSRNIEEVHDLVNLLIRNFQHFSPSVGATLNLLNKTPRIYSDNPIDMLDSYRELLLIPSNYFSMMLGGDAQQSIDMRMSGLARLDLICSQSGTGGKLVLKIPVEAQDRFVDFSDNSNHALSIDQLPIMQGVILSSEQNRKTAGDDTGYPVAKLLKIPRDQMYYLNENGMSLPVRELHSDYQGLNTDGRIPYQYAFKSLVRGVFSFSKEAEQLQLGLKAVVDSFFPNPKDKKPDEQRCLQFCDNSLFQNLPQYTAWAIGSYLDVLNPLNDPLVICILSITDTLEVLVKRVIPDLNLVAQQELDLSSLHKFIGLVNEWWKEPSLLAIRKKFRAGEIDTKAYLKTNLPSILSGNIRRPIDLLQRVIVTTKAIRAMHPVSVTPSNKMSPIHEFAYRLQHSCEQMFAKVQTFVQFMGEVDDNQMCNDPNSFLAIYGKLRELYCKMYSIDLSAPDAGKAAVKSKAIEPMPPQEDEEDRGALRRSITPSASPSPQQHQGVAIPLPRSNGSSAHASPRGADLNTSISGQQPKSPQVSNQIRPDNRRSGSMGGDAMNSKALDRQASGSLKPAAEVVSNPSSGNHGSSTKVSPRASPRASPSPKVSPGNSATGSPREAVEGQKSSTNGQTFWHGAEGGDTEARDGARRNVSLRRKSLHKSAQDKQVQGVFQGQTSPFKK